MLIRPAQIDDSPGLADVQVASYQTAYKEFLPDDWLAQFTIEEQTQDWRDILADPQHDPLFVAVDETGKVVGYALGKRLEQGAFDCELVAMHVLAAYQRQGIGRALMTAIARHFADAGCTSLILWTIVGNSARAMYEKLGGALGGEKIVPIDDDTTIIEVAYGWSDIQQLC